MLRHLTLAGSSRRHGRILKGALKRPLSTDLHEISPPKSGWAPRKALSYHILTLDPKKFAQKKQRRLCIGNIQKFSPHVTLTQPRTVISAGIHYDRTLINKENVMVPYPPDTEAFLYYFMSPKKPRIAGELRLRVTSSNNPASFKRGLDLLRPDGQVWSRPLYHLSKYYSPLYEKLREDGLIPDDLHTVLATLPPIRIFFSSSRILYTLNDTFMVDFNCSGLVFIVITEQGVGELRFKGLFSDARKMSKGNPYTGSALARFERSTIPDHEGTRNVVLRFLKIITPVKCVMPHYDGYIGCPKEGDLYQRTTLNTLKLVEPVWSVDVDNSKGVMLRGLRLLWDTKVF